MRTIRANRAIGVLAVALALALGLAACGTTVSTGSYKGASKAVAQRIADFQTDVTASDEKKLCANDLARVVQTRLQAAGSSCVQALKIQLGAIQSFELTVKSIAVHGAGATARVSSTWSGKQRTSTMRFAKEGGAWRIAALQ
jgi:NADPH:quinone reductase-like Zn-dependent oxidoreductase